jgi:hypothetical protein
MLRKKINLSFKESFILIYDLAIMLGLCLVFAFLLGAWGVIAVCIGLIYLYEWKQKQAGVIYDRTKI